MNYQPADPRMVLEFGEPQETGAVQRAYHSFNITSCIQKLNIVRYCEINSQRDGTQYSGRLENTSSRGLFLAWIRTLTILSTSSIRCMKAISFQCIALVPC